MTKKELIEHIAATGRSDLSKSALAAKSKDTLRKLAK